jgi:hypothetical protein
MVIRYSIIYGITEPRSSTRRKDRSMPQKDDVVIQPNTLTLEPFKKLKSVIDNKLKEKE